MRCISTSRPDELAAVLAHIIGHVAAHHESFKYQQAGNRPGSFAAPFSAKAEREANDLAVSTLEKAGYDPSALTSLVERMSARRASTDRLQQVPAFVVAHPLTPDKRRTADPNSENSGDPARARDTARLREIQKRIRLIIGTIDD